MNNFENGIWDFDSMAKGYMEMASLNVDISNEMIHMEEEVSVEYD